MSDIQELITKDLNKSGLTLEKFKVTPIDNSERSAAGVPMNTLGYKIPYFDIEGKRLTFYRIRLFNEDPKRKYRQLKGEPNHVYYPKDFLQVAERSKHKYITIVEGEKKAAALNAAGYPTVGLTGVDSWKNKILYFPEDTQLVRAEEDKGKIKATLPQGSEVEDFQGGNTAVGFESLVEFAILNGLGIIILFDNDRKPKTKFGVQRAASMLALEIRFRGVPMTQIRQIKLPLLDSNKMAIDDYLVHNKGGHKRFAQMFVDCVQSKAAFPIHPDIRKHLNSKLQKGRMSRKEIQSTALAVIADIDTKGYRMYSRTEGQAYYFDSKNSKLMKAHLAKNNADQALDTAFGKLLYQRYGLSMTADKKIFEWMATQYVGEEPIAEVDPHRVIARPKKGEDAVRMQLSDSHYVKVDADGITIIKNGEDGMLFEANRTEPVDIEKLQKEIDKQSTDVVPEMWWDDVLQTCRLKQRGTSQSLVALLYYVSPWLYRWRGAQMPVELVLGESGSGKSSLCELRLAIQTGRSKLRNAPSTIKDWHAAIANSGGLHVTDNVQLLNNALRTALSDDICRLITEPQPEIEMRKLYSDAELMAIKVDNVFCFTAIAQPFMAADLLQRSVILEFDKSQEKALSYDSMWMENHFAGKGGREGWLAHHFVVLQRFFQEVRKHYDPKYKAKHRLINFEQALTIMARDVFKVDHTWIPEKLSSDVDKVVAENDYALSGLHEFVRLRKAGSMKDKPFTCKDITDWAIGDEEYSDCVILVNSRKLGKYMSNNKHIVGTIAGIQEKGKYANKMRYELVDAG